MSTTIAFILYTLLCLQRPENRDEDHGHDEDNDAQTQAGTEEVHELQVAGADDQGVGAAAHRGQERGGRRHADGHGHGGGVHVKRLHDGDKQRRDQQGAGGVHHGVGQQRHKDKDDRQHQQLVGVLTQQPHGGVSNERAGAAAAHTRGNGTHTGDDEQGGQVDGLIGIVLLDAARQHENKSTERGGKVHRHPLDVEGHGHQQNGQNNEAEDGLGPVELDALVAAGILRQILLIGGVTGGQELLADGQEEYDARDGDGNADLTQLEKAHGGDTQILQRTVDHDVAGGAHQGQVAAKAGGEGHGDQLAGDGNACPLADANHNGQQHGHHRHTAANGGNDGCDQHEGDHNAVFRCAGHFDQNICYFRGNARMEQGGADHHHGSHQHDGAAGKRGKELCGFNNAAHHEGAAAQHGDKSGGEFFGHEQNDHDQQYQ